MTRSLEEAFAKAAALPEAAQEQLAEQMLTDIEGELNWDATWAGSQDVLERMANDALRAQREGRSVKKGFDELLTQNGSMNPLL